MFFFKVFFFFFLFFTHRQPKEDSAKKEEFGCFINPLKTKEMAPRSAICFLQPEKKNPQKKVKKQHRKNGKKHE
jgi:hypothetical protein